MYCIGPTVQSVCSIPWDYTGLHRTVPICTVWGQLSRVSVPSRCPVGLHGTPKDCTCVYCMGPTVQSVCPIPLYRGTTRDFIGLYLCVLYGAHCPECLSHPVVPWDYTGLHRTVYQCVLYGAHCPECLSHPAVPWDCTGLNRSALRCVRGYV